MIKISSFASGSSGNLYIASTGNTNIVLECGVSEDKIKNALINLNLNYYNLNAVFTSHVHMDHSLNIKLFQDYDIPCYCTFQTCIKFILERNDKFIPLCDDKIYKINDMQILSFKVDHGKDDCFGFILADKENKILFITDFMKMNKILDYDFSDIYIECNYVTGIINKKMQNETNDFMKRKYLRQINTHQSLDNLIYVLENKINLKSCKSINIIHISKDVGDPYFMKYELQKKFGIPTYAILGDGEKV